MIKIIDCGSQLTQNIARRVRALGVYAEITSYNQTDELGSDLEGIIISGGKFSVMDEGAPLYDKSVLGLGVPVLGICYGQQSIAYLLDGEVVSTDKREYGKTGITITKESPLFKNISQSEFRVWMSHADIVHQVPGGFEAIAVSQNQHIAAMQDQERRIYAVQFHPEVDHTQNGTRILDNFIEICGAQRDWDSSRTYQRAVEELRTQTTGKRGVGGISGGVDSTTASVLLKQVAGDNYHPIFVDNGLLRLREVEEVIGVFSSLGLQVNQVDASDRFLQALIGVTDPDQKRKIIGKLFIKIFEEEARKLGEMDYLLQGTLYPDVIESVPIYGSSDTIKRHHNVGGLPERMELNLVEPFRYLFKDEVRRIAEEELSIPRDVVWRHPFPGPGLAIRILGEVTPQRLDLLRQADAIYMEELKNRGLYDNIAQAFAVLMGGQAVGVMGDGGTYEGIVALRAVTTNDFMTSDWYDFSREDMGSIVNRIVNEVRGVNRVVYDVTQKPPGTIEWE